MTESCAAPACLADHDGAAHQSLPPHPTLPGPALVHVPLADHDGQTLPPCPTFPGPALVHVKMRLPWASPES